MKQAVRGDWRTGPLPERRTVIPLERTFAPEEMEAIRRGLIPEVMEDKWFVFWEDGRLHFHRSWTGFCLFILRFEGDRMVEAEVNRDPEQYSQTSDEWDRELVSFLVDLLLLGRPAALPASGNPERDALALWSLVGRALSGEGPEEE